MVGQAAGPFPQGGDPVEKTAANTVLLVVYILLALVCSFLCSVAEAVLLSISPGFIAGLHEEKPALSARLKGLKQKNVDRSLAAILTLNTIAHTVGSIGAGAEATIVFGSQFMGMFSTLMTLAILFLSEIIPKTLGAVYWRQLAVPMAWFVQALIFILYPLIWVSEQVTRLIAHGKSIHAFSRDEFVAMAQVGEDGGQLRKEESRIIRNLLMFESLKAVDIMTPRTVMTILKESHTVSSALKDIEHFPFSRIPVFKDHRDNITGFVLKDEMLLMEARDQGDVEVTTLRRDIMTVPDTRPLTELLDSMLENRAHIALVTDSYGGTAGLVTLEDIVETLLGMEIIDEMDTTEDMQKLARRQWKKRARRLGIEIDDEEPSTAPGKPEAALDS
jgi:CBS domain containing-hemolysin-like protein